MTQGVLIDSVMDYAPANLALRVCRKAIFTRRVLALMTPGRFNSATREHGRQRA